MKVVVAAAVARDENGHRGSKVVWLLAALLVLFAVGFDLLLQAPLAGLVVSVLALLWTAVALVTGLVKRQGISPALRRHKVSAILVGTYFASVACGLLVSRLVLNEAQALRLEIQQRAQSGEYNDKQQTYASFCAARLNGRCGWMNYRIVYSPDAMPTGANVPGTLVVFQFFTERASIAIETGAVVEWRSVD
ncbi:hypothetical protein [Acidovorax kalamii]|uniref:hypothetical protein n=1 Tax=Acidovorax kalamii TaxID=2004485 RepID=UPI002091882F|nr:hypothetical protein [Acidovorax kalamii]MCO5358623.1 hypothetical protein [Acidovorax kalamii]